MKSSFVMYKFSRHIAYVGYNLVIMSGRSKHYTAVEKNMFLQILIKYKNIIENKKSNANTLREKEAAWEEIVKEYNNASCIVEGRNLQQLKKLWTNLKQGQRDALTKEKQARFTTGGEPEEPSSNIDPNIAMISPNLMTTAPIQFTSNMNKNEIQDKRQEILGNVIGDDSEMEEENYDFLPEEVPKTSRNIPLKRSAYDTSDASTMKEITLQDNIKQGKKFKIVGETEEELKMQRLRNIMKQEQELAEEKLKHEQKIKEAHLLDINLLEKRAFLAKAELAELLLKEKTEEHFYVVQDN